MTSLIYAGGIPLVTGLPPVAGLLVGPLLSAALIGLMAIRAVLEERTLIAELEGYADYANRVRYRLVPRL